MIVSCAIRHQRDRRRKLSGLKAVSLPERMQFAVEAGAKRILIPSENKRDVADVPDAILTAIQWQFYDSPSKAAIMALGLG
jgi:ATP-dependent Lon protease